MFKMTLKKTLGALAVATGVAASGSALAEDLKVGFVYVGPISDHGWSYMHNEGRVAIENQLGVPTTYVESVNEGPDAERVITKLAKDGHNLIFTTSYGFMNQTLKVAKRFPNVKFEHATGYRQRDNVSTYSARFYEGRYVVGHVVGKMTKTNTIGYIASFPIPEVIRGINATILGARKVNPDVQIKVVWVNTWVDPGKEGDAAKALIDQGADVIMQHTDSPSPLQVAQNRDVWAVGQASDMKAFAPKSQLTAIIDNWAPYYVERAKAVKDGTWKSEDTWGGFASGMVELADYNEAIPADVVDLAKQVEADITSGKIHAFAGPIKDQKGNVVVKEGEVADDKTLLGMNFYVEGVQGELPQ